jgi:hypothetical protein
MSIFIPDPFRIKFFATAELVELVKDRAWLVKVTNAVNQHWHKQNARKKSRSLNALENGHTASISLSTASGG